MAVSGQCINKHIPILLIISIKCQLLPPPNQNTLSTTEMSNIQLESMLHSNMHSIKNSSKFKTELEEKGNQLNSVRVNS